MSLIYAVKINNKTQYYYKSNKILNDDMKTEYDFKDIANDMWEDNVNNYLFTSEVNEIYNLLLTINQEKDNFNNFIKQSKKTKRIKYTNINKIIDAGSPWVFFDVDNSYLYLYDLSFEINLNNSLYESLIKNGVQLKFKDAIEIFSNNTSSDMWSMFKDYLGTFDKKILTKLKIKDNLDISLIDLNGN